MKLKNQLVTISLSLLCFVNLGMANQLDEQNEQIEVIKSSEEFENIEKTEQYEVTEVVENIDQQETGSCFWMENWSGKYFWVPVKNTTMTKEDCYMLDSCDGGLGYSNGGCFKWAVTPDSPRLPW